MHILHVSDTHGRFPVLNRRSECDVIVHSGDLLPNQTFGVAAVERSFQDYWVRDRVEEFRSMIGGKPFIYTPGNHDFIDPTPVLREAGIDARLLCDGLLELGGVSFYGFPWTPTFYDWNWMCGPTEMQERLLPVRELLNQGAIDVLVTHGPMFGVLDRNSRGERCGSRELRNTLQECRHPPQWLLCGHIHEAAGTLDWKPIMKVSNAATTQRLIEVI